MLVMGYAMIYPRLNPGGGPRVGRGTCSAAYSIAEAHARDGGWSVLQTTGRKLPA